MRRLVIAIALLLPSLAAAQPPQPGVDPCGSIGGCSTNAEGIIAVASQNTAALLVAIAAGASVLFVVYGGFQMLISFGDESAVTKGRNAVLFALGGFALTLSAQAIVSFVISRAFQADLQNAADNPGLAVMAAAVGLMMSVFNIVFVIIALGAGFRMVLGHGQSDEFNKARTTLIYAVIGAIVINVARALVNVVLTAGF